MPSVEWDRLAPKWKDHTSLGVSRDDVCACITQGMAPFMEHITPSDWVLNIGSGSNTTDYLPGIRMSQLLCLDLSHEMLAQGEKSHAVQADVRAGLPLQTDSIGLCVSFFLLRYLPASAHQFLLTEMARVLQPGGRFVLLDVAQNDHPGQLSQVNAYDIGTLARSAGLGRVASHQVKRIFIEEIKTGYGGVHRINHPYQIEVVHGQKMPLTPPVSHSFTATRSFPMPPPHELHGW